MRVEVYWNLHKRKFSVRALEGNNRRRVIDHVYFLALNDVKFIVQPAGREKVRKEGKKNVHAFVRGKLAQLPPGDWPHGRFSGREVLYNPYMHNTFVDIDNKSPVHKANRVLLDVMLGTGKPYPRITALD